MTALDEAPVIAVPGRTDDVILAEKSVLASMISFRDAAEQVLEILDRDDCFADPVHRAVFAAVRHVTEEGTVPARGTVLDDDDKPVPVVQQRYGAVLSRLIAAEHGIWRTGQAGLILGALMRHASPAYLTDAATVLRGAIQRRTVGALETALEMAAKPGFDPDRVGDAIRALVDSALTAAPETTAVTAADLFLETLQRMEDGEAPGTVRLPWRDMRDLIPWLRPGQLVTILARPSIGKSIVAGDIARFASLHDQIPAVLFTMEMDRSEVMDRLISAESGVSLKRIIEGDLDDDAWDRITKTQERFAASELVIDDTPRASLAHLRAVLRAMARRQKAAQLAIVDYVQLMAPPEAATREQEVSGLVGGLKAIAREFRIPVVMLCQLNRGPEHRQDKRPHLSDARESGSVENDSDIAILIHRPDFYEPESARAGEADLIVEKNRNGPRSTVTVGFHGHYARTVDLARRSWSPSTVIGESA